ncbi:helix-turn-helix domain-containing protein [Fusibacter ferrireducens]|uniref:Helix-turn-helix domain-containing protein n=1 Tax=Fusibacter ferrireducens TaxID=2785058 RepID=A0ABR9ZRN2_9FIRM|nr:helix-turn-helix domain-containing protein [Fusibacter ferrireducens]MBF4693116.1 helix-turn-helix domain-containing protein [Fusibacter ferrireducens]
MEDQIEAVQRMQNYIQMHLYENITLSDLANVSLYSPWHSYRLFVKWLNRTPADYIRRLRLSKSALKLRDTQGKVIDIAFEVGFDSVDGYQRAFFREFGCNPHEYAKNPIPIYLFIPYGIETATVRKEKTMEPVKSVFIQVLEKPIRKVLIKRGVKATGYFDYCAEVGCDIWGLLKSMPSISGEPVGLWLPKTYIKPGTSEYVQGVEVPIDYNGAIPEGLDIIELPKSKYLMFQGEPFEEKDYAEAIEQVWNAIKKYNPSTIGYTWDHSNPRMQLEPIGTRGYIELLAIQ